MGLRWYGRDRVWKDAENNEYRWEMGISKPELFRNVDGKKGALVAKFHQEHSGLLGIHDKTLASLEIFGEVSEAVLDMILVTFIYMEVVRKAREKATNKAARSNVGDAIGLAT
ncbi:hypothetical protein BKA70DRAFT_677471 [Coprinopsis sp. MPI-PUGE-AT-0042]|nr:hypothetical protein BKA70DRAFT_677471 [Coprinopsis sp. MPI-PUGE-AT-0042]